MVLVATSDPHYLGGLDEASGKVRIGIMYPDLCKACKALDVIMLADGQIKVRAGPLLVCRDGGQGPQLPHLIQLIHA